MRLSSTNRFSRTARVVALSAIVPLLAACSGAAPHPSSTTSPTPTVAMAIAPVSGVLMPASELQHPSLAAKIDNHEAARPQWGLNQTDVVFEELVEGGLTRYVAVWHSNIPQTIGPVRSIRPMDPDIISPFGGIVAYSGGQQKFVSMMQATDVYNAVHGASDTDAVMYRTDKREAPHNVLVKAQELVNQHKNLQPPQQMFSFAPTYATHMAWSGTPVNTIKVSFSGERYPTWTYDKLANNYVRSQEGSTPDYDANGFRVHATNVVVMMMKIDRTYGYVPKTVMIGSGKAWISSGGKTTQVTWSKKDRKSPIVFTDAAGNVVTIPPGNTWIEMPPNYGSASFK